MRSLEELNRLLAAMEVAVRDVAWRRIEGDYLHPGGPPGCIIVAMSPTAACGLASGPSIPLSGAGSVALMPAVGGGVEFRLGGNVSIRAEYQYRSIDAGDYVVRAGPGTAGLTNPFRIVNPNAPISSAAASG